ncbi:ectoine/hydroxyectoine ABC transporter substrate-binding protein EhuB [Verticiella sediminum]|uniref:Ectoine/hydroxyectoine ABC transporter substrate-binding protein EhuB n=2 Tax=Verticiella sediminum TaxID=1247510 RepID=A0A556A6M3_9BURK|nr:ectoine/hydroxyectoine ABC transporter substrate-binding protein EhuB [Verticiella sediminum]
MRSARFALALGCTLSVTLAACSDADKPAAGADGQSEADTSTLAKAQEAGRIRIGYANEAPFAYMDSSAGQLTGEAPEVLRHVLDELGIKEVEGVLTEFGSLIPGLQANRFDIIAAGMYVTPERCKQAIFSNPTYGIGSAFVVREGNPKALDSFAAVAQDDSARLGVVVGAIEAEYADKSGVPAARVVVFPDAASALAGVQAGRVDAYAATSLTVNDLLGKGKATGVERAEPFTDPVIDGKDVRGYGAFAFRNDDTALRDAVNEKLAAFIGSPAHLEAVSPFGFTEAELPGDTTAAMLCGEG